MVCPYEVKAFALSLHDDAGSTTALMKLLGERCAIPPFGTHIALLTKIEGLTHPFAMISGSSFPEITHMCLSLSDA